MTLRMDGTASGQPLESAGISAEATSVTYTAPANSRLVAVVTTGDGATYQYVEALDSGATDATFDFGSITALTGKSFTAEAWIETDMTDGGALTYATEPVVLAGKVDGVASPNDPEQPESPEDPEIVVPGDEETSENEPDDNATLTPPVTDVVNTIRPGFWEDTVVWNSVTQTIRLYDDNHVLPADVKFSASLVDKHPDIDSTHTAEHTLSYELRLTEADGNPIQLSAPVRLMFEVVYGIDVNELEIIRATLGDDVEFGESYVALDGRSWVQVETDHFSPYALIDKLTGADQADSKFVKTGDDVTYLTISGLGLIMTLALGLMFKINFGKRKFDE